MYSVARMLYQAALSSSTHGSSISLVFRTTLAAYSSLRLCFRYEIEFYYHSNHTDAGHEVIKRDQPALTELQILVFITLMLFFCHAKDRGRSPFSRYFKKVSHFCF